MPITMSRTVSEAVKCFSTCGVCGIGLLLVSVRVLDQGPIMMNGKRSFLLDRPPVQLATGRDIPLVVAVLVYDKKVVNLRGYKPMVVGDLSQHFL
jgi:hypothetical protein